MSATLLAFLRSSCHGMGITPRHLDAATAQEDPLTALLEEAIALRTEQRADLSLQLLEIARSAGLASDWIEDNRARALLALDRIEEATTVLLVLCDSSIEAVAEAARSQLASLKGTEDEAPAHEVAPTAEDVLTPLLEQAIALRELGDAKGSLQLLDQAEADGLCSPWLDDNRARALAVLGKRAAAEAIWRRLAGENDETLATVAQGLAEQLRQAVLDDLFQGIEPAAKDDDWSLQYLHAELADLGATEQALLEEAIACREAGKAELSLVLLEYASQLGFDSPWLRDNQARALVNLGRRQEAIELWEELSGCSDQALSTMAHDLAAAQRIRLMEGVQETLARVAAEQGVPLQWLPQNQSTPEALVEAVLKDAIAARERGQAQASLALLEAAQSAGLHSGWLRDNQARALVHLQRIVEAVAIWRDLTTTADEYLARASAEMLALYGKDAERKTITDQANALLAENKTAEAIQLLTDAILKDPSWEGWREGLKRAVAMQEQHPSDGDTLLSRELQEPQLALRAFGAFLKAVEQRRVKTATTP